VREENLLGHHQGCGVHESRSGPPSTSACARIIDERCLCSAPYALTIKIASEPTKMTRRYQCTVEEVICVIAHYSERWCHVTFKLPLSIYLAIPSVQSRIPLLEYVTVRLLDLYEPSEMDRMLNHPLELFSIAPQLRVIDCFTFPPRSLVYPSSAQLTSFSGCVHEMRVHEIFGAAPLLVHASFQIAENET
jgi:hypothetical protein